MHFTGPGQIEANLEPGPMLLHQLGGALPKSSLGAGPSLFFSKLEPGTMWGPVNKTFFEKTNALT